MTEADVIALARSLPGVAVTIASEEGGAPESAWGDAFFFYDPDDDEQARKLPFATVVVSNYPGFDEQSDLDRPGVYRLNASVGRERVPAAEGVDYAALGTLLPHPVYATQGWVSILCPAREHAEALLAEAHARAAARHDGM